MKRLLLSISLTFFHSVAVGQQPVYQFHELLKPFERYMLDKDTLLEVKNAIVKYDANQTAKLYNNLRFLKVRFENCDFPDGLTVAKLKLAGLEITGCKVPIGSGEKNDGLIKKEAEPYVPKEYLASPGNVVISGEEVYRLKIKHTFANSIIIGSTTVGIVEIDSNEVSKPMEIHSNTVIEELRYNDKTELLLMNNQFKGFLPFDSNATDIVKKDTSGLFYVACSLQGIIGATIEGNTFEAAEIKTMLSIKSDNLSSLSISYNSFQSLEIASSAIDSRFIFFGNRINGYVSLTDVLFPERYNVVYWNQLQNFKLTSFVGKSELLDVYLKVLLNDSKLRARLEFGSFTRQKNSEGVTFFQDEMGMHTDSAYLSVSREKLFSTYYSLHNIYKQRGDVASANLCFVELKELEGQYLATDLKNSPSFAGLIRYLLNRLMFVYTRHGTDPALAVIVSFYVLLSFAILFLFFPSSWDVRAGKNGKRNLRFFLHRGLNSLTLSVNSFVTLGFGNIPTRGAAKYLCIFEGFIGWFLLSIFMVALINQVLF